MTKPSIFNIISNEIDEGKRGGIVMLNLKLPSYFDTEKVFFGFADTVNPNASTNENQIVPKVVILEKKSKAKNAKFEPIKTYEYHNINKIIPLASYMKENEIGWLISSDKVEKIIERTGLEEAKVLKTEKHEKVLKKAA